jgi:hypothetical protein
MEPRSRNRRSRPIFNVLDDVFLRQETKAQSRSALGLVQLEKREAFIPPARPPLDPFLYAKTHLYSGWPRTCICTRWSALLTCSKFVFVSSKTIVTVWAIGLASTDFTPGRLEMANLASSDDEVQTHCGTFMTIVRIAAKAF